jgi:hypothetical protein
MSVLHHARPRASEAQDRRLLTSHTNSWLRRVFAARLSRATELPRSGLVQPSVQNIATFAEGLRKPYSASIRYVDKKTHQQKTYPLSFTYVPVRLPDVEGSFWLIVVTGTQGEDWLLLSDQRPKNAKKAVGIIHAYVERWGNEEVTRLWKQCVDAEDVRVRKLCAIRRLLFLSMLSVGVQALWLLQRPKSAQKLIARVKVFIPSVRFLYYRLWRGVADALDRGG